MFEFITTYSTEIIASISSLTIVLIGLIIHLEIKVHKLLLGGQAKNLPETITALKTEIDELKKFRTDMTAYLKIVERRLSQSVQGVGTVRFNAFKGIGEGGGQSFATSLIDEKGDGVVISSLYSRDHVSVFAKPLKTFVSTFELSGEEQESLRKARETIRTK